MKFTSLFSASLFLLPLFVQAQSLQAFFGNIPTFFNRAVIPALVGVAFLIFVINVVRFFVIEGGNQESKEKAHSLALYGVMAFTLLLVFWALVNIVAATFGLENKQAITPDYFNSGGASTTQQR